MLKGRREYDTHSLPFDIDIWKPIGLIFYLIVCSSANN